MKIGIDIGNVITSSDTDSGSDAFSDDPNKYLNAPQMDGAFKSVGNIVEKFGAENVYLISKCGEKMQRKTGEWLEHQLFFDATGVLREHVLFCLKRNEKAPMCETLGINIFIDDRYTVLEHMVDLEYIEGLLLFQPSEKEYSLFKKNKESDNIFVVKNWNQVMAFLS